MAGDLLMSISQDERERAVLRSRKMFQTDMQSNMATSEDIGEKKGRLAIARSMIEDGVPVDKIIRYTGLTHEEVENLNINTNAGV